MSKGIWSEGDNWLCSCCGRQWSKLDYRPWWPISFRIKYRKVTRSNFFGVHYFQSGWRDVHTKQFCRVIKIGWLIIYTGKKKVELSLEYIPEWDSWLPPELAARVKAQVAINRTLERAERIIKSVDG